MIKENYKQLLETLDNLEEMDTFLETHCREITISQNGGGQALTPCSLSLVPRCLQSL